VYKRLLSARVFTEMQGDRARGSGHKLKQEVVIENKIYVKIGTGKRNSLVEDGCVGDKVSF